MVLGKYRWSQLPDKAQESAHPSVSHSVSLNTCMHAHADKTVAQHRHMLMAYCGMSCQSLGDGTLRTWQSPTPATMQALSHSTILDELRGRRNFCGTAGLTCGFVVRGKSSICFKSGRRKAAAWPAKTAAATNSAKPKAPFISAAHKREAVI